MIEQRIRQYAEQILNNESLTEALNDHEAQSLIHWGLKVSEQLVKNTGSMADETAEEKLYPAAKALRRLMRTISRLVGNPGSYTHEEAVESLSKILEYASQIPVVSVNAPEDTGQAARLICQETPAGALDQIMSYVSVETDAT